MSLSFPPSDFDDWAESYDNSLLAYGFPFFKYAEVLKRIVALAEPQEGMKVLDLGTGTGNLAVGFTGAGCELWCIDFSEAMLKKAKQKLPHVHFYLHDLRTPLPPEITGPFDRIVSAYVFHHFNLEEKLRILERLRSHMSLHGRIVIGDVAFLNRSAQEEIKSDSGKAWEEEHYWVAEETLPALSSAGFLAFYEQVSPCAGIYCLENFQGNTDG